MFSHFPIQTAVTYQEGPGGFVIAVTHAPGFGLLHFMTVDPAPQLMGQPASQINTGHISCILGKTWVLVDFGVLCEKWKKKQLRNILKGS